MNSNFTIKTLVIGLILFTGFGLSAQSIPVTFTLTDGSTVTYIAVQGGFGQNAASCDFPGVEAAPALTNPAEGCDAVDDVTGTIAMTDRGSCQFSVKSFNAQNAGAIASIICNNVAGGAVGMAAGDNADDVTIPCGMLSLEDCNAIKIILSDVVSAKYGGANAVNEDSNPDDLIVWGDVSGQGDFNGGLGDWESVSLSCAGGSGSADWEWIAEGSDDRASCGDIGLSSETRCNGVMVFNSDYLDTQDACGSGADFGDCTAPQEAELTSPVIDLSGVLNVGDAIGIKFQQAARQFDSRFFVEWSQDGGANWVSIEINEDLDATNEVARLALGVITDPSQLRVRFYYAANYYYWAIDDVKIFKLQGRDASLKSILPPAVTHSFPADYQTDQVLNIGVEVANLGAEVLDDLSFDIKITNIDNGLVYDEFNVATDSTIALGQTGAFVLASYSPDDNLDVGNYRMDYSLALTNSTDDDLTNNVASAAFEVTGNYFAKENGTNITHTRPAGETGYTVLNSYTMPNTAGVQATTASFSVDAPEGASLTDNSYVHLFLLKLKDGLTNDDIDIAELDLFSHPSLDYLADNFVTLGSVTATEMFDAPFSFDETPIDLEPGATYFVAAQYDTENLQGLGGIPNNQLEHSFGNNADDFSGNGFLNTYGLADYNFRTSVMVEGDQWYATGFGQDTPALLRLNTSLSTDVADEPLPVGTFKAFPNPTTDFIFAELNFATPTDATIFVADITGKIILTKQLNGTTSLNEKIDVSALTNGTYLLRVATAEGYSTEKFVIQN